VVQRIKFHPTRPLFFIATQTMVKVYDLAKQELVKKLQAGVKWISSIDIHPGGDNLILGGYDKRVCWFDLDLSSKPHRVIRQHKQAVRGVCYHPRYPLFASCSDDACITVCHGMVYDDLMENPLIVPVKVLRGHKPVNSLGVLEVVFHPHQPWLISAGADSTLRLYS
jgi:ribosome biogenesis protein ERB1